MFVRNSTSYSSNYHENRWSISIRSFTSKEVVIHNSGEFCVWKRILQHNVVPNETIIILNGRIEMLFPFAFGTVIRKSVLLSVTFSCRTKFFSFPFTDLIKDEFPIDKLAASAIEMGKSVSIFIKQYM